MPTEDTLVRVRTLEDLSPQFEMTSGVVSSSLHDTDFQYYHLKDNIKISIPFSVTSEVAVVTAHLQSSFLDSGLQFYIESEEGETSAYSVFESPHRLETYAVVLTAGKYKAVFEEKGAGPDNVCNHFSAAVLIEAEDQWDSYDALLRKTNGCGFADLPRTLNIIGELEEGMLHWHRDLPLDVQNEGHRFPFVLDKQSVLRLVVEPVPDVVFLARIFLIAKNPYKMLVSKDPVKGIHTKLEPGNYILDVVYGSETGLPQPNECEQFSIDLHIVPEAVYTQLAEMSACSSPTPFPATLKKTGESRVQIYTDTPLDTRIKVEVGLGPSLLRFQLTYESALVGPVRLELYDSQGARIARSFGVQDYSSLSAAVTTGAFSLRVFGTMAGTEFDPICSKLLLWYTSEDTNLSSEETCEGSDLPEKLFSQETAPYGGPQEKDGSVSFYGVFRIPESRKADKMYIRIGESSIARVLTITSTLGTYIETMLFQDLKMTKSVGFSKNAGRAGSFILALEAKYEPYILELTYSMHKSNSPCSSFELAIEIERKDTVKEKLTCDQALKSRSLLPDMRTSLSGKETKGGDSYTIRGSWLIGDAKTFPQGVTSPGTKNIPFIYQMQLDIKSAGRISVSTEFDFLTNDIYLQLLQGDTVVGKSLWLVLGAKLNEDLELASSLEDVAVEAGMYTLVLRQAVAANHLVQMFEGVQLCFPFAFAIKFEEQKGVEKLEEISNVNKLVEVIPADKSNINPSKGLAIVIAWEFPIQKGKNGSYVKAFFLESDKKAKIHPGSVRQEKAKSQMLELTFKPGQLPLGTCFNLRLNIDELDLTSEDTKPEFDFVGAHSYCTGNCACNPKAEAKCSSELECICPEPYDGVTCEECVEGYTFEDKTKVCLRDECANCPGACVNGKCQTASICECGDFGECVKSKCKCQLGFTGDKCNLCEDEKLVFPECADCQFDQIPANITYSDSKEKSKFGINRKGEFTFSADRVEKKIQTMTFRLHKTSELQVEITDSQKDTKVLLADFSKRSYKPTKDETENGVRSLAWDLMAGRAYTLTFRGREKHRCDSYSLDISLAATQTQEAETTPETTTKEEPEPFEDTNSNDGACQGHGRYREDATCWCDVGYIGSSCGKCDDGFEMRAGGTCVQKFAPPATIAISSERPPPMAFLRPQEETGWSTILMGVAVFSVSVYAMFRIYKAKTEGREQWHRREMNPTGFDGPDDEEEDERRGLQDRSRMRRTQDPTL